MKIEKTIYNNIKYDAIEVSFREHKLCWVGYHSNMLIMLMEHNWQYTKLLDVLIEQWKSESYYSILQLHTVAPAQIVKAMKEMVRVFICECVLVMQYKNSKD